LGFHTGAPLLVRSAAPTAPLAVAAAGADPGAGGQAASLRGRVSSWPPGGSGLPGGLASQFAPLALRESGWRAGG
jgi:hypothetical protein